MGQHLLQVLAHFFAGKRLAPQAQTGDPSGRNLSENTGLTAYLLTCQTLSRSDYCVRTPLLLTHRRSNSSINAWRNPALVMSFWKNAG